MGAVGREDPDPAGAGSVEVPSGIKLEPVGNALGGFAGDIGEDATLTEGSVVFNGVGEPDLLIGVGVRYVERFLVRREADSIGAGLLAEFLDRLAVGAEPKDAVEGDFFVGSSSCLARP